MEKREAFKMFLKPGFKDEYKRRHAALWPEMKQLLHDGGVYDYSIWLDEDTNTLFACQKTRSLRYLLCQRIVITVANVKNVLSSVRVRDEKSARTLD